MRSAGEGDGDGQEPRKHEEHRGRVALGLAAGCAVFASLSIPPATAPERGANAPDCELERSDEVDELARELRAPFADARRRALRKLAELDRNEAWELVLEALSDSYPEVADEAQFQIAGLSDPRLLRALAGREGLAAQDDWRRLRAAEAFGRMRVPIDAGDLLRALARSDPDVSRAVLWSVERLSSSRLLTGPPERTVRELERACERPMPDGVRASALCALTAFDLGAALPRVREGLHERSESLRAAALSLAHLLPASEAFVAARDLAADESASVRLRALDLLGKLATRDALAALAERLELEERPRLRWRAVELLQRLSAMKYRLDARPWKLWISGLAEDWQPSEPGEKNELGDQTVAFAGLPILSDRVAFLIDFSGSMWREREDGKTCKEVVDQRLREVLAALPVGTEFNVVPYTDEPLPWKESLVASTAQNVRAALEFFAHCDAHGRGNFFDAALSVLQDPRVDTIVVLTDGVPTGGRRWNLDLMMPLLVEEVRFRAVAFDSIVVGAPPRVRKHWAWLAERTGGRSIAVEL